MGLSSSLALIGSVILIFGLVLLLIRKQRRIAIACLIAGLALILIPYTLIYVFLD